jgi:hypothetical protein
MCEDTVDTNWMLYYSSNKIVHQSFYFYHKNKMINELVYLVISLFNYISSNNINIIKLLTEVVLHVHYYE